MRPRAFIILTAFGYFIHEHVTLDANICKNIFDKNISTTLSGISKQNNQDKAESNSGTHISKFFNHCRTFLCGTVKSSRMLKPFTEVNCAETVWILKNNRSDLQILIKTTTRGFCYLEIIYFLSQIYLDGCSATDGFYNNLDIIHYL